MNNIVVWLSQRLLQIYGEFMEMSWIYWSC